MRPRWLLLSWCENCFCNKKAAAYAAAFLCVMIKFSFRNVGLITDTMQRQAAAKIDRQIGGTEAEIPRAEEQARVDTLPPDFEPYRPKCRKTGTGCVTMINDHLYEGRYTPTNAYGKRESHNIYAKTRDECEEKLAAMIVQVKADIKAEKEKLKTVNKSFSLEIR